VPRCWTQIKLGLDNPWMLNDAVRWKERATCETRLKRVSKTRRITISLSGGMSGVELKPCKANIVKRSRVNKNPVLRSNASIIDSLIDLG
jgi:hypothetical protein